MTAHKCVQTDNIKELFRLAFQPWTRALLVGGVITLFALYAGMWVYATDTFASKSDVKETQEKVDHIQENIHQTMTKILEKVSD